MIQSPNYNDWEERFQNELHQAELARAGGKEGMARVCARRAAGIVINEYFRRMGISSPGSSAHDALRFFQSFPYAPEGTQNLADHFLERVDTNFTLPGDIDLILDARWLATLLLSQS